MAKLHSNLDDFSTLCVVRADLSPLSGSAEPKAGKNGKTYWTIVFSVEIHFGLTEFKARINGPASIIYNERGHRAEEEEPDAYPEDDVNNASPRNDRLRSEPVSRALTPVEPFYHPSRSETRGFDPVPSAQPSADVASIHRTPSLSEGHISPSHTAAVDLSRDLSFNVEPEKVPEPEVLSERTPSLAPSLLVSSSPAPPPDLSRSLEPEVVIETRSPKDRKGKGKKKTPVTTPKIEETLPPVVEPTPSAKTSVATPKVEETLIPAIEPTPTPEMPQVTETLSSSLWATDPVIAPDPASTSLWGSTSPARDKEGTPKAEEASITVESKRLSFGWGSTAPSVKSKAVELPDDPAVSKTSPAIGTSTSPLTAPEPVVAAEAVLPAAPATPSPALTGKAAKKAKKKGASAAATPAATPATQSIESPPVQTADPPPAAAVDAPVPEATGETKDEPAPPATVEEPAISTEKPLTPIGLPEVTLSTKTPEPTHLAISDEVQDSISSLWTTSTSDPWGTSDKPKTPKSRPKTPVAETNKTEETEVSTATPAASVLETKSTFGWGATVKTPSTDSSKPTGLAWGASIKKSPWGTSGAATPISTSPGWGSSFGTAAKSPSIKSTWSSKLNTPTTTKAPSSPWGVKPSNPVDSKEDAKEESKEETKEDPKEESKESSQEPIPAADAASADTTKSETPTAEVMKTDDKIPTPKPTSTDLPAKASAATETETAKVSTPKTTESELKADTPQPAEVKQPTPQPSPKPAETPLDPAVDVPAEPETPLDPVTPSAEENKENEEKEEEKEEEKKTTGGGGAKKASAAKKKKKKK
ncbi:hypothetical protein C0995_010728 [Termitomyces sp. Mi166|nr:hypothetical protein C0995_010728 [Termitomyces sp. Mi166\